jgi:hypothetical protein
MVSSASENNAESHIVRSSACLANFADDGIHALREGVLKHRKSRLSGEQDTFDVSANSSQLDEMNGRTLPPLNSA